MSFKKMCSIAHIVDSGLGDLCAGLPLPHEMADGRKGL